VEDRVKDKYFFHKGKSMKKIIITILTAVLLTSPALAQKQPVGATHDAKIIRVTDGDTVVIAAPYLPAPIKPELAVRIFGVDTPEKGFRGQCESEKQLGEQASTFTKDKIKSAKKHQVVLYRWDKFGGRVLGDLLLDGRSLRSMLLENGFAKEYYGSAKTSWCN
jgi:endonuclease YncB( thermonuclease family)